MKMASRVVFALTLAQRAVAHSALHPLLRLAANRHLDSRPSPADSQVEPPPTARSARAPSGGGGGDSSVG